MRPDLEALAGAQGGIFTRRQALTTGYAKKEFDRLSSARGAWLRVRYGVYVTRQLWDELGDLERLKLRDRAALLVCDLGTVLSHSSAARRHRLDLYDINDDLTHVTRLRTHGRMVNRVESGVKHHCGQLDDTEIENQDGIPVTSPLRTVMDIAGEYGYRAGLVAADSALRVGACQAGLLKIAERWSSSSSAPTLRAVALDADGRSESALETLARVLLRRIGVVEVEPQFVVKSPTLGNLRVDLIAIGIRHVFECDGKLKYQDQIDERGRRISAREVVWREKLREDELRGLGFGVSRLTWPDVVTSDIERVSARLWREIRQQNASGLFTSLSA